MKSLEHLSQSQIAAYADKALPQAELHEIGCHLIQCPICRNSLPLPSVERFWSAIIPEREFDDSIITNEGQYFGSISGFTSLWKTQSKLVWNGAILAVLIGFSLVIWFSLGGGTQNEIARSRQIVVSEPENESVLKIDEQSNANESVIADSSRSAAKSNVKVKQPNLQKLKFNSVNVIQSGNNKRSNEKPEQISSVRGVSGNCEEKSVIEFEFVASKEDLVFKWKKVPNAVKYHVYISDDDEILIDEYETAEETSFVLKKPLDPLKTYKWKIIATLENGEKLVGESRKFTVKTLQNEQLKPVKRQIADTRCPAK